MKSSKIPVFYTIHYADSSTEKVESGVLGRIQAQGEVWIHPIGMDIPDFLTVVAGLESVAESLLKKDPG